MITAISERDAICIVSFIHRLWFQERSGGGGGSQRRRTNTSLLLECAEISDQAMVIFVNLLQTTIQQFIGSLY